ncbi:hypothetical protein VSQ48_05685 [Candidatus Ventrimonas sp. KK005]|nr:hypothetical protein [Lachnospiraceae bacterium]
MEITKADSKEPAFLGQLHKSSQKKPFLKSIVPKACESCPTPVRFSCENSLFRAYVFFKKTVTKSKSPDTEPS